MARKKLVSLAIPLAAVTALLAPPTVAHATLSSGSAASGLHFPVGPHAVGGALPLVPATSAYASGQASSQEFTDALTDSVQQLGEAQFADVYTGIRVTNHQSHVIVFLTSLDKPAEAAMSALAPSGVISFARSPHNRQHVLAVHANVTAEVSRLATTGLNIVSWFPGIDGDGLEHIGVVGLTPAGTRTLDLLFGASNIAIQDVAPEQAPRLSLRRNSDDDPWNGGDNLTSHGNGCTSGVGIHIVGKGNRMLTAAHCYVPGWSIWNAFAGEDGTYMGTEESRDVTDGGDDTAILNVNPSGLVWTGVIGSPVMRSVTGYATNPDGYEVCNEGAYSGEVCSVVQNNDYGCITISGYTGLSRARKECHLVQASACNSCIASQEGDSGGPMIRYVSGALKVTGLVSAGGGYHVTCRYNATSCSSTVYYTAMNEIVNTEYPGSSLVT